MSEIDAPTKPPPLSAPAEPASAGPILFYDSDCGFCNRSIRFVLSREQEPQLRFAPIGGATARAAGIPGDLGMKSLILLENDKLLVRTRAVQRILHYMGGRWHQAEAALRLIPTPLGDLGYRFIALIRRSLPGAKSCGLLTPEQRARFLD